MKLRRWYYSARHAFYHPEAAAEQSLASSTSAMTPLRECWQHSHSCGGADWRQQEFLVVDTETSALEIASGELLSVGWVVIRDGRIVLGSAEHWLLKPQNSVGESATIHTLRDCELDAGLTETELMRRFLQAAAGRALVFHHAGLDLAFLNRITRRLYGAPLLLPVVDTLQLEKRNLERRNQPLEANALRLANCCKRYNLPLSKAHNALTDALATAELLLAQVSYKGKGVKLRDLIA